MGTIIFIITVVIEAVFIITCILTKSNQDRLKSSVRISALTAFVLMALASVIQWGFRWYFLGLLLFVWAALGARALLAKQRVEKKEYTPRRSVLKAIGTLVWWASSLRLPLFSRSLSYPQQPVRIRSLPSMKRIPMQAASKPLPIPARIAR